jgi:hypothetical protein
MLIHSKFLEKDRTEFGNNNHNIPSRHHTLYTSDHNPEKKEKSSPFYYTARAFPLILKALH